MSIQIAISDIAQLFTLSTLNDVKMHAEVTYCLNLLLLTKFNWIMYQMVAADQSTSAAQTSPDFLEPPNLVAPG